MIAAEIDCAALQGRWDLHEQLKEKLSLPAWYGRNLDALYDCLSEPGEEITLTLRNAEALEQTLGGYGSAFLGLLEDLRDGGSRVSFVLSDGKNEE